MNWFEGKQPSRAEMRRELTTYFGVANGTKKHVARTKELIIALWLQARSRPYSDVWSDLGDIDDNSPSGVIKGASIKAAFRDRMLKLQGNRCCYCRRWLVSTAYARPIEHILPRRHYPQFSIEFWNLAVACADCNTKKTDDNWGGISKVSRRYPGAREFTDFFHPRFHRYNDHIRYVRVETNVSSVVLFTGLTPQGQHLCRSLLHRIAAKETLIENNPVLAPAMNQIRNFGANAEGQKLQKLENFRTALDESLAGLLS